MSELSGTQQNIPVCQSGCRLFVVLDESCPVCLHGIGELRFRVPHHSSHDVEGVMRECWPFLSVEKPSGPITSSF